MSERVKRVLGMAEHKVGARGEVSPAWHVLVDEAELVGVNNNNKKKKNNNNPLHGLEAGGGGTSGPPPPPPPPLGLDKNPLAELVKRSHARGACDEDGLPVGFPTPWAFSLATYPGATKGAFPTNRSLGFQAVTADGVWFVCRGGPGGAGGPRTTDRSEGSLVHVAGNYPGAGFEEQWRIEGYIVERGLDELQDLGSKFLDDAFCAEVAACRQFERDRVKPEFRLPSDPSGRPLLRNDEDVELLAADREKAIKMQKQGEITKGKLRWAGVHVYCLQPERVELLEGGPAWPNGPRKVEWLRNREWLAGLTTWREPQRTLPYSAPETHKRGADLCTTLLLFYAMIISVILLAFVTSPDSEAGRACVHEHPEMRAREKGIEWLFGFE